MPTLPRTFDDIQSRLINATSEILNERQEEDLRPTPTDARIR